jgi:hypothetical protein
MTPFYRPLGTLIWLLDDPLQAPITRLFAEHADRFAAAPGSRQSHQAWPGGYVGHVEEVCNIGIHLWMGLGTSGRPFPFALSDFLLVLMLHDVEKPFLYGEPTVLSPRASKAERAAFRRAMIDTIGLTLTDTQSNALSYVEGEGDDYRPGERVMGPLAAFCHMCDVASARLWPDYPLPSGDPWAGDGIRAAQADPGRHTLIV